MSLWDGFDLEVNGWNDFDVDVEVGSRVFDITEPRLARVLETTCLPNHSGMPNFRVELENGYQVIASNIVFPGARKDDLVWVYPSPEGGVQLHDSNWMQHGPAISCGAKPLRLGDIEILFAGYSEVLHRLLREIEFDRGTVEPVLSRAKLDELYGRLAGEPDAALRQRAFSISRELTYGDVVLARDSTGLAGMHHYGWDAIPAPRSELAVVTNPSSRPITLGSFDSQLPLIMKNGQPHPRPGMYFWAAGEASSHLGKLSGYVVEVSEDFAEIELLGVIHKVPRHSITWSATAKLTDFVKANETVAVAVRCQSSRIGLRLKVLLADDASESLPRENELLPPGSWRVLKEVPNRAWVAVAVDGKEFQGVVRDRWLPVWDDETVLRVLGRDDFRNRMLLGDEIATVNIPLSERWMVGDTVRGIIRATRADSVIVDVAGFRGRIAMKDLPESWRRTVTSQVGNELDLQIIELDERRATIMLKPDSSQMDQLESANAENHPRTPRSKRRQLKIELAKRRAEVLARIAPGQVIKGFVTNIIDRGAFIDLGGFDGWLRLADMRWGRINHPSEMVEKGQEVEVIVLAIDYVKEHVALGLKQKEANPWENLDTKYCLGTQVRGKVVSVMSYGALVQLESGIEGLLHIRELSWMKRVNHPTELVNLGDEVNVVLLDIDKDKQLISLSLKRTQTNPWDHVRERYPPGTIVTGKVSNISNYGAFVELEAGVDGLLHLTDMSWTRKINHPTELLKKGDQISCRVLSVNQDQRRLALGLKQLQDDPWEKYIPEKYQPGQLVKGEVTKITPFGAFIKMEDELDGLVHKSEFLTWQPSIVGAEVNVWILRVDILNRKIGLSQHPVSLWPCDVIALPHPKDRLIGTVTQLDETGAILSLDGGGEGRVMVSELGWGQATLPIVGQRRELEVLRLLQMSSVEPYWKIDASFRLVEPCPWDWDAVVARRKPGTVLEGVVFAYDHNTGLGLVSLSGRELAKVTPESPLKIGEHVSVVIEQIDTHGRQIVARIRANLNEKSKSVAIDES